MSACHPFASYVLFGPDRKFRSMQTCPWLAIVVPKSTTQQAGVHLEGCMHVTVWVRIIIDLLWSACSALFYWSSLLHTMQLKESFLVAVVSGHITPALFLPTDTPPTSLLQVGHEAGQCAEACTTCGWSHEPPRGLDCQNQLCSECQLWGHDAAACPDAQCNR